MRHRYSVGEKVEYRNLRFSETSFTVMQLLPTEDSENEPRYRIKSLNENFERVVHEGELNRGFQDSGYNRVTESKGSRSK